MNLKHFYTSQRVGSLQSHLGGSGTVARWIPSMGLSQALADPRRALLPQLEVGLEMVSRGSCCVTHDWLT